MTLEHECAARIEVGAPEYPEALPKNVRPGSLSEAASPRAESFEKFE